MTHRPVYHFLAPTGWMNDPNGLIRHRGSYHLFYQWNPGAAVHGDIHWGHAVSDDLVRWRDLPIALAPRRGTPDEDGCFSGCTVIDGDTPTIVYTGARGAEQLPCVATACDDELLRWRRDPGNPVIAGPPPGLDVLGFRDHAVWREDGRWCMLIGSGLRGAGATVLLYHSDDLREWTYAGPLLVGDGPETMWECPDCFALGEGQALVVSAWDGSPLDYALCFTGHYAQGRLLPRMRSRVDHGRRFYAPQSLAAADGRRIQFGWLVEARSAEAQLEAGWSGVMSLPRELGVDAAGRLTVRPAGELRAGRGRTVDRGRAVELVVECPARGRTGVSVLGGTEIVFDGRSVAVGDHAVPFEPAGETIRLHVFVDHSVLEVFVDERIAISERVYADGDRIRVIGAPSRVDVWERPPIWAASRQPQQRLAREPQV